MKGFKNMYNIRRRTTNGKEIVARAQDDLNEQWIMTKISFFLIPHNADLSCILTRAESDFLGCAEDVGLVDRGRFAGA